MSITIALENVRSAWNVGSVFRSCDALGYDLILVGYTPCPTQNNLKLIAKTAIGAQDTVKWSHFDHPQEVFENYKESVHLAIEISDKSHNILDYLTKNKQNLTGKNIILWFGNEIHGVSDLVTKQCESELHLPMAGLKESLNVSSCMCAVGYMFALAMK
jgi:23S rRNA (guanosine2251-2'-O)-methyltransferase